MLEQKELKDLSIREIAKLIKTNWSKVNFAAKPYLDAMFCLESVNDNFGCDSGKSMVLYFLCNASSFKGEIAREIKKELNRRVK